MTSLPVRVVERHNAMAEIQVTHGYNGTVVSAGVGDVVTLLLPEIPGTGYRWSPELDLAAGAASVLALAGDEFQSAAGAGVGGGGTRVFRFAARAPGHTLLRCALGRSWEGSPPRDVFSVEVWVR